MDVIEPRDMVAELGRPGSPPCSKRPFVDSLLPHKGPPSSLQKLFLWYTIRKEDVFYKIFSMKGGDV
jgi:hypothetical protein